MARSDEVSRSFSLAMSARDLVNIGIFAALYIATVFAGSLIMLFGPVATLIALPVSIVLGAIPYMLFLTRVKHAGMVTLFAVIIAGVYLLAGHPWVSTVLSVIVALLAEIVLWLGRYRSRWSAILTYAVYSIWFMGPMLPIFFTPDAYFSQASAQALGPEYEAAMRELFTIPVAVGLCASTVVAGVIGGLLGSALLRKHFVKAGLA